LTQIRRDSYKNTKGGVDENSVIGAGAVVTKDVPANSFVAGVPAKVIRSLEDGLDITQVQPQINAD